jgi:hypothetical protein
MLVLDEVRAPHLHHDERVQALVPGQVRLVALAAAEQPHGQATGSDLVALPESPCRGGRRGLPHREQLVAHAIH